MVFTPSSLIAPSVTLSGGATPTVASIPSAPASAAAEEAVDHLAAIEQNLEFHLDIGNIESVINSTTQNVLNLATPASGAAKSGYNFFRGATGSGSGDDPSIQGTPGNESSNEYLLYDGGDYIVGQAVPSTFINSCHKAGASFTAELWFYFPGTIGHPSSFIATGRTASAGDIGFAIACSGTGGEPNVGKVFFQIFNGSTVYSQSGWGTGFSINSWHMLGLSIKDGGSGLLMMDGVMQDTRTIDYPAPSSSNATDNLAIGGAPSVGGNPHAWIFSNGSRVSVGRMYNRNANANELAALWDARKARFGLS